MKEMGVSWADPKKGEIVEMKSAQGIFDVTFPTHMSSWYGSLYDPDVTEREWHDQTHRPSRRRKQKGK